MPLKKSSEIKSYDDKNRLIETSNIPYETGAFAPVLLSQDEMNVVSIRFTGAQYTQLLSSALTGALILYPDNPLYAVFPLLECVDMPVSNCESIADCIENSEAVRNALSNWFAQTEYAANIEKALAMLASAGTGYSGESGCDLDLMFGTVTSVFDEIYQSCLDWIEILDQSMQFTETLTLWGEELTAAALAAGGAPAVVAGILTVISNVVEQFITDLLQSYQAGYTTELRDELRCEFFCLVRDDCAFTALDILEWLESELQFTATNIVEIVGWFFGLTGLSGRTAVLAMWYFELSLYRFAITNSIASYIAGQAATEQMVRLTKVAQAADSDSDWLIFCDCAPTVYRYLGEYSASGLTPFFFRNETAVLGTGAFGLQYSATVGVTNSNTGVWLEIETLPTNVSSVTVRVSYNSTRLSGGLRARVVCTNATGTGISNQVGFTAASGTDITAVMTLTAPQSSFRVLLDSGCAVANDASFAVIHSIVLE